jgi:hypothetical protein
MVENNISVSSVSEASGNEEMKKRRQWRVLKKYEMYVTLVMKRNDVVRNMPALHTLIFYCVSK